MTPEFGCSAHDMLFEPINTLTQNVMCQNIKHDIERWEPRVSVVSVDAYSEENTRYFKIVLRFKVNGNELELNHSFNQLA